MKQEDLARHVGFGSRQIVSDLERGARSVKASELVRIARALRTDVDALLGPVEQPEPAVLWRSAPTRGTPELQTELLTWCRRYAQLLEVLGMRHEELVPSFDVDLAGMRFSDAENMARRFSDMLDLGVRPAAVLPEALESRLGILVWYLDTGSESAAACVRGLFGSAILVPRSSAPWRRNFDIAHELFHLLTWNQASRMAGVDSLAARSERLANCFAAALLLPEASLLQDLDDQAPNGAVSAWDLVRLARDYDVSTDALLWRLLNLGRLRGPEQVRALLADAGFREIDRQSKAGARAEPPRLPGRFLTLAYKAMLQGRLSRSVLADYLGCGLADVGPALAGLGIVDVDAARASDETVPLATAVERQERCDDPESSPLCFA
jgi:Zn-dependent peptidase ImmA (M78 family)/transcriptional regulator with XRE-family HTH domain